MCVEDGKKTYVSGEEILRKTWRKVKKAVAVRNYSLVIILQN
jgi:hypothetical protein